MKNLIQTALVTLFAVSTAHAQQAVQWKASDGGNGHWYEGRRLSAESYISWNYARDQALQRGGELVSLSTPEEAAWVFETVANDSSLWSLSMGPWVGGFQSMGAAEPSGGWSWLDGSVLYDGFPWGVFQPDNATHCGGPGGAPENHVCYWFGEGVPTPTNTFADLVESGYCLARAENDWVTSAVMEWDADCNADGIIDYGQCHDGSLPDYNGNNIPDCCEQGVQCTVGNYPVQWHVEDGGNGHWYAVGIEPTPLTWTQAQSACSMQGAALASLGVQAESDWVFEVLVNDVGPWSYFGRYVVGPWIGGRGRLGNWQWDDGSVWNFAAWLPGEGLPNSDPNEQFAHYYAGVGALVPRNAWGDYYDGLVTASFVLEWSADCNSDGIVDYGQILTGQLADANTDGIPDICQQPTCREADLFRDLNVNGADLGILLSQWGPNAQFTVSDINKDGFVNGADLGLLLSFWGACP
jgi:hypothetical protein